MILIRRLQAVAVPQQRAHSLTEAVLIGFLGSVIEKCVGNEARVSSVLYILWEDKGVWLSKEYQRVLKLRR